MSVLGLAHPKTWILVFTDLSVLGVANSKDNCRYQEQQTPKTGSHFIAVSIRLACRFQKQLTPKTTVGIRIAYAIQRQDPTYHCEYQAYVVGIRSCHSKDEFFFSCRYQEWQLQRHGFLVFTDSSVLGWDCQTKDALSVLEQQQLFKDSPFNLYQQSHDY